MYCFKLDTFRFWTISCCFSEALFLAMLFLVFEPSLCLRTDFPSQDGALYTVMFLRIEFLVMSLNFTMIIMIILLNFNSDVMIVKGACACDCSRRHAVAKLNVAILVFQREIIELEKQTGKHNK